MSDTNQTNTTVTVKFNDSASVPRMQRAPGEALGINSAQVPNMQAAPNSPQSTTQTQPQAQQQTAKSKGE